MKSTEEIKESRAITERVIILLRIFVHFYPTQLYIDFFVETIN